jgi:tetratricopeptide (TPR) repeat protein
VGWLAVSLAWGPAAAAQPDVPQVLVSVAGQVTTQRDGIISSPVAITVESAEGRTLAEATADSQGHFLISNLLSGRKPYWLTVKAEGYAPVQQSLDLRLASGTVTMNIVMTPVSGRTPTAAPPPTLTDLSAPRKARKAFEQGALSLAAHRFADARRDFSEAAAEDPCYARAQTALAAVLVGARELPAAEAALRKAIECDPAFSGSFVLLARVLNSQKQFAESEAEVQQGLRLSPQSWELHDQLATALYEQGLFAKASDEWRRAAELNPSAPPELHAKLSGAYIKTGEPDKALAEAQAYLRAEPDGPLAKPLRVLVQQLESGVRAQPPSAQALTKPN